MSSLGKWQIISFVSRSIAMVIGLVQSFVIIRLLTVEEWGLIQLAVSVGAALGIYQHLGLASASTREISSAEKKEDIFKIFLASAIIRYLVTIPVAVGLFFASDKIANQLYLSPQILLPLKIYAVSLLFQGVQSILNSVISGQKRFKALFIYQGAIAVASMFLYIPLVYLYKINGYFYAFLAFTILSSIVLSIVAFLPLRSYLQLPGLKELKLISKELFSLSVAIYIIKIIVTNWEKLGANLLGFTHDATMIGIYSFALLYAKKLMHVSDSVTDVNLPVLSEKYANDRAGFEQLFSHNFNKIYAFIVFAAVSAIFWVRELVILLVGDNKYDSALPLILPMVFAFLFYSLIDIIKSSVIIPARHIKEMYFGFFLMLLGTGGFYFICRDVYGVLNSMSYGMLVGSGLGFSYLALISQKKLRFNFFGYNHVLILLQAIVISFSGSLDNIFLKGFSYVLYMALFVWAAIIADFISVQDINSIRTRLLRIKQA